MPGPATGAAAHLSVLEIRNLVVGYGQRALIHNLFFAIPEPAFVAVIGHNGSGKTTFFKALLGQVPYQGHISLLGHDLKQYSPQELAGLRSYLPQKNELRFPVPVRELVVMGRYRFKRFFQDYTTADYAAVDAVLTRLHLQHLQHRDINQLSGGEQQLVWLAQLMVQEAQLWLLDEPAQQLDVYNRARLYRLLGEVVEQQQRTVVCITHDLHLLPRLRGYLLNLSKPQPVLEVITEEAVEENLAFLERGVELRIKN